MEAALDKAKQYEWFALKLLPMIDQGWLMSPFYLFTILVLFSYGLIFLWVGYYNHRNNTFSGDPVLVDCEKYFSILIPFRDEAHNLGKLIEALGGLNFPKTQFEVLFIDDHSQDDGAKILEKIRPSVRFSMEIISLSKPEKFGKKQAILQGIQKAKHPWIITLDADSIPTEDWLQSIERTLSSTSAEFITGPVFLNAEKGLLFQLQATEFMALQALTRASFNLRPLLSNGTNLAYSKTIFEAVEGFSGNLNISSGDDMFLMRKIWRQKKWAMAYNMDWSGAVQTTASQNWATYAAQQLRWMSKTSALKDPLLTFLAFIVLCTNALMAFWIVICWAAVLALFPESAYQLILFTAIIFSLKFIVDHLCLWASYAHLDRETAWSWRKINWPVQLLAALIYPFWSLGLAMVSVIYKPHWKGRKIQL